MGGRPHRKTDQSGSGSKGADPCGASPHDPGPCWHARIFDRAPCVVLVVDDAGRILLSNRRADALTGFGPGGLQARNLFDLVEAPEAGDSAARDVLRDALLGGAETVLERPVRTSGGGAVLTRFTFVRVPAPDGAGEVTLCVGEDVSGVRRRESELRESEHQAKAAFRLLADFSGISSRILHETSLDEVCMLFIEAIREHSDFSRAILTLIDEQGKGYLWYFTGLTDAEIEEFHRNKLSDDQRGSIFQERFRLGNSYYIPHDSGWGYRGVPSRAGHPRQGPGAWHPEDFLFIPLYGSNRGLIGMVSVDDPADRKVPTPESLSPLELFANQVAHCIEKTRLDRKVRESLEKLEAAREQLVQAEKLSAIGELVSGVAHELNNPLTGVMGYAQLLLGAEAGPAVKRSLEKIHREATRCQKIVQNLLLFARRRQPERRYHSINDVVKSTLELREYQLRVDNVRVVLQLDEKLPRTMVDFYQLQQVFLNIINNAHQAMVDAKGQGTLTITTGAEGDRIRVVFEDDGPGIRKEHVGKIFDPFFTTKEVGRGTGLGLSLSYGIVKEHGGTIQVRSRLGFGTAMSVEIPVRENEEPAGRAAPPGPEAGGRAGSRVLVVDDEEVIVSLLEEILTADGHRVEIARNGLEALHRLRTGSYDFVLSDLRMPGMNGEELYEKVGAERPDLLPRIVFTTGDVVSPEVQRFLKRTGNRFLTKPFSLEEVLQAVRNVGQGNGGRPAGSGRRL